jgi:hypothetical protein
MISDLIKDLSPRDQFKVAFLEKCAKEGLTPDEILTRVKIAQDRVKQAETDILKTLATFGSSALTGVGDAIQNIGIPAALMAPPIVGALGGRALAKLQEPTDDNVKDIQHEELMSEYRRQIKQLAREKNLRQYREQDSGRGGRPML